METEEKNNSERWEEKCVEEWTEQCLAFKHTNIEETSSDVLS